ncbi:hypothetical protein GQX74_005741 [Glossina fuscipes]|nr:hypothetical protein GQX74_005741 [Glossina fuscipes]
MVLNREVDAHSSYQTNQHTKARDVSFYNASHNSFNNVNLECITYLIALKIKNVGLNLEKENELKQKKLEAHRQRVLNLSKKESKRPTKLAELNKELEETHAEEHKQAKNYKLIEIIKIIFAHVINLDFFADLIDVLNRVLETQEDLGYHEQLHCIQTIFAILSGQGEILNTSLYVFINI